MSRFGLRKVIHEAHRRSLWQVLAIYLAGSWVALQVVDLLAEHVGLPSWFPAFAVGLLVIGLPIVLATAFVQEGGGGGAAGGEQEAASPGDGGPDGAPPGDRGRPSAPAAAAAGTSPPPSSPGDDRETAGLRRFLTWKNAILGGVAAFALLGLAAAGYMTMRTMGVGPVGTLVAQGVLEERDRILLADFENRTDDPLLSEVVTEALRVDLSQSPTVRLAEAAFVRQARERMELPADAPLDAETAREAAQREGIKAVLTGEIGTAGPSYVLTARLLAPETGAILTSQRETASDSTQVVAAIDRLSRNLRERIGESLKSLHDDPPLERVTTGSLEALRTYSQAVRAIEEQGEVDRGIALLEEAVALDSSFAMAWRKLGVTLSNKGERRALQVQALERAYRHRDRLTERERYLTTAAYHWQVTDERDRAVTAYRNLLELNPSDPWSLNNLAVLYSEMREFERAEELFLRADAVDSTSFLSGTNAILAQLLQGEVDEARRTYDRLTRRFPDNPRVESFAVPIAAAEHDYEAAERHARTLLDHHSERLSLRQWGSRRLASIAMVRGRLAEARRHLDEAASAAREGAGPSAALELGLQFGLVHLLHRRDTARALAEMNGLLERHPLPEMEPLNRPYLTLASTYAWAGRPERARALLAEWEREVPPELRRGQTEAELRARGAIARAEGRHEEALELIRRSDRGMCMLCAPIERAIIHDVAGRRDSAIAAYERYLTTPQPDRLDVDGVFLPRALERLGQLHEAAGHPEEAARYYARFVDLWSEADPELQPRVERARERLAQLRPEAASGG